MTVQEAQQLITNAISAIYSPGEAAAVSDWMIEFFTGKRRSERLNYRQTLFPADQEATLHQFIHRLQQHEPIQYILQEGWFCGFRFFVNENVLIPRPETEELVEWIIADCRFPLQGLSILDLGTGSGCIPVSLKRRLGKIDAFACDISEDAIAVAQKNAQAIGVEVEWLRVDMLDQQDRRRLPVVDVIVSNPPYIPLREKPAMAATVTSFEPAIALFVADEHPLVFYEAIAEIGMDHLKPGGKIYVEISEGLGAETVSLFEQNGYITELKKDMQGKDRMIRAVRKS